MTQDARSTDTTARNRVLAATMRPRWIDAVSGILLGTSIGLTTFRTTPTTVIGVSLGILTLLAIILLERQFSRRRDPKAATRLNGRSMLLYGGAYALVFVIMQIRWFDDYQPWWAITVAVLIAAISYAVTRWLERRTVRYLQEQ
ncbi:MAG: hypothetical protein Q4G40_06170 [Brachybacterium sp.]|nr:hypothetical protein [Brachybacterium sp.]